VNYLRRDKQQFYVPAKENEKRYKNHVYSLLMVDINVLISLVPKPSKQKHIK